MKICYIVPDLGISVDGCKGASAHIRGFTQALMDLGHEVTIFTSCPVGETDLPVRVIPLPNLIDGLPQKSNPHLFRALRHLLNNASIEQALEKVITEERPDLIYERYSPFSVAGGIIAGQHKISHILEVNAPLAEQGKRYRKQALQEASEYLEQTALLRAGRVLVLTEELKQWVMDQGVEEERIILRPCGVDIDLFSPKGISKRSEIKGDIVIGFVGSLKPWHDVEMLTKIFPILAEDPRYHLLVVGDGPSRSILEPLKEQYPDRVTLTGAVPQNEVPQYIRAMDIALAPYPALDLFYFSPLKSFESMACGKPLVATEIGQLRTLIQHGKTGLLVPPGEVDTFVAAIRLLADDPELREQMGTQAAEEIQQAHTWEHRAKTFIECVEDKSPQLV